MSGGIAYVLDEDNIFKQNCNAEDLNIDPLEFDEDINQLKQLIKNHFKATSSPLASRILENWETYLPKFKKVLPEEYKQALVRLENEQLELA